MPRILEPTRQMLFKLVLFGLPGSGRVTNLKFISERLDVPEKGELTRTQIGSDSTLSFDFELPDAELDGGYKARFQLFSAVDQARYQATHELLLRNADGVVLVIDSDRGRLRENQALIENLAACLETRTLPPPVILLQLNKRDLATAMPVDELREALEIPPELTHVEAHSNTGRGVFETLNPICQAVMDRVLLSTA